MSCGVRTHTQSLLLFSNTLWGVSDTFCRIRIDRSAKVAEVRGAWRPQLQLRYGTVQYGTVAATDVPPYSYIYMTMCDPSRTLNG